MPADGAPTADVSSKPRRYDSTHRRRQAAETRRRILDAAAALFAEHGWGVGVREIARAAGVSFDTVYANFGSKPQLLNEVLDVAVVGDDEPVALMERPEFAALSRGSRRQRAAAAAALVATINGRTRGLHRALREGAAAEPDLATRLDAARRQQRETVYAAGAVIAGHQLGATQADGLWAVITMEVYDLLTGTAGWSRDRYEKWLTETILSQVAREE